MRKRLAGLENLLLLHGEVFPMDNGYWTKIEAWETLESEQVPHGSDIHSRFMTATITGCWDTTMLIP